MLDELLEKTKSGRINVCVLGLGRVGLPFAAVLAKKGIKVFGIDINEKVIESIPVSYTHLTLPTTPYV